MVKRATTGDLLVDDRCLPENPHADVMLMWNRRGPMANGMRMVMMTTMMTRKRKNQKKLKRRNKKMKLHCSLLPLCGRNASGNLKRVCAAAGGVNKPNTMSY